MVLNLQSQGIRDMMESQKTGAAIALTGGGTSMGSWLDVIPDDIGKLGVIVSMCLGLVLIYVHLRRDKREARKLRAELAQIKKRRPEASATASGPETTP